MKIVVLDGYALNPGDLSWDELSVLGVCSIQNEHRASKYLNVLKTQCAC